MKNKFITIKDFEGVLRPKAYLERVELHDPAKVKLLSGDVFVEVEIIEVKKESR